MSNNKSVLPNGVPNHFVDAAQDKQKQYSEFSDDQLISLIGTNRDRKALTEFYNRYQLPVARFLNRQVHEVRIIEEVYNDVMLIVWDKAASFKGNSKVSTWLFSIAYRTRLKHVQKESRHKHVGSDEFMANTLSDESAEPDVETAINEALHAALIELSEPHRTVIELTYFHGYTTTEIASIVRIPQNTVKTRLFHARKKLKEVLEVDQAGGSKSVAFTQLDHDNFNDTEPQSHFFSQRRLVLAI